MHLAAASRVRAWLTLLALTTAVSLPALGDRSLARSIGTAESPATPLRLDARSAKPSPQPTSPPHEAVQIEMQNVHLHAADGIVLDVRRLRGTMISRIAGRPPVFDDGGSYVLHLDEGELAIDMGSLERLLNQRVFAYQGAPLEEIRIRATDDGRLEQTAKLHKGIAVPVSMKSSVAATPDGQLRLHVESMKAAGIPAGGLLKLFGLEVDDLVKLEQRRGVVIRDNDIVIGLGQVLPPPEIRGHLTAVFVRGNDLVQVFDTDARRSPAPLVRPDGAARNYVYFHGGNIRFGKLTMTDADLQLIDADPSDPFDFFPARYKAQLVAGYSKNTASGGLKTYMPDFNSLTRGAGKDLRPRR